MQTNIKWVLCMVIKKKKKVKPAYYIKEVGIKSKTKLKPVVPLEEVTRRNREGLLGASFVLFLPLDPSD